LSTPRTEETPVTDLALAGSGRAKILRKTDAGRPDGRVGWCATRPTGTDVLSISEFRMLDVATTA
jgi:hypothetical protein